MKDDAKFFFFIGGFAGFLVFYLFSSLICGDFLASLLYGSIGCVLFAMSGRALLGFALTAVLNPSVGDAEKGQFQETGLSKEHSISGEQIAAATNVEALENAKGVALPKSK